MTPTERAIRSAEVLWDGDRASKWFGYELLEVEEGRARMRLQVGENHVNGHGICHGGVIFSLADSAFAFACNSRNMATVAQMNTINFLAPGQLHDVLIAVAEERHLVGRNGIYEINVNNQSGAAVASMRGCSRALGRPLFPEPDGGPE